MKFCSKCKKVYADSIECECTKKEPGYFEKKAEMVELDCDPKCKCGSTENLTYHPIYKFSFSNLSDRPAYCECSTCKGKWERKLEREDSMKYLVIDYCQDENKLCDEKSEVEEFLKYHTQDYRDSGTIEDVLILKLEPLDRYEYQLKEKDFKPGREWNSELNEFVDKRTSNSHLVIWDGEIYRVEEVIVPSIEYEGGITLNW